MNETHANATHFRRFGPSLKNLSQSRYKISTANLTRNCQSTFHNNAAQRHPFPKPIVANSWSALRREVSELSQYNRRYAIGSITHRKSTRLKHVRLPK